MLSTLKKWMTRDPAKMLVEVLGDEELPSFPSVHQDVLRQLRDPNSNNERIAATAALDPGLSKRILQTVNSAAMGLNRQVTDVARAASLLGRAELESLVLALAVRATATPRRVPGFEPSQFWRAAAHRAAIARALARRTAPRDAMMAFTVGLLQDMAIPILAARKAPAYALVLVAWRRGEGSLTELERKSFGWDHAQIGGLLAMKWKFPGTLADAIANHHTPDAEIPKSILLTADIDETGRATSDMLTERVVQHLGMSEEDARATIEAGEQAGADLAAQFNRH